MPTEGNPNPEPQPDTGTSSENTPFDRSPEDERKSKESGKSSVSETPSDKASPDDPPAAKAPEGAKPADHVDISGTEVTPSYNIYYYDSLSSDDDDDEEEDEVEFDESWIDSYSAESNPHWIAIRDACGVIMDNARMATANYEWHSKRTGRQFDTKRLDRLTSQLTTLSEDLEELVAITTPQTMFPGWDVNSLSKLIRLLSEMGIAEVRGKIDVGTLVSIYKGYKSDRREKLSKMTSSRMKAYKCLYVWEQYRAAFVGFYKETQILQKTQGRWGDVVMSREDLLTWNKEMRKLAETAKRLLLNVRGIVEPLISQLGIYFDKKRELKTELASFLDIGVPSVYGEKILLV